jgi:hypothetical protein
MDQDKAFRQQLGKILDWGEAHTDLESAVTDLPAKLRGEAPEGMPHSAWQLVEHIRLTLWDILEFSRDARYKSPPWPEGYWPKEAAPPDAQAWEHSVKAIKENNKELRALIEDPKHDLFAPLPHGSGQTLLREVLLAADHTSYHLGQLILVRRALGAWKE